MSRFIHTLFLVTFIGFTGCTGAAGEVTVDGGNDDIHTEDVSQTPTLDPSTTVYGYVMCGGRGVPGVAVSDGFKIVKTDGDGLYQIASSKKLGYVFVCIPSGYTVPAKGILPQFYRYTDRYARIQQLDFELISEPDQSEYEMIVIGDIQLARRSDDIAQFSHFTNELRQYLGTVKGKKVYALTLGDMTWDSHWLSGPYGFSDYVRDMSRVGDLKIFHAMGNHDHELETEGDFLTSEQFRKTIGPTYYSFDIGEFHYVVLDNIECTNDGSGVKATYNDNLVGDQIKWLKLDLALMDRSKTLVMVMHAPLFKNSGSKSLDNADDLLGCLEGVKKTYILSGHTHIIYNVDRLGETPSVMEMNSGAVCATWWYTGYDHPWLHIGRDGAPGGYRVLDITGGDMKWYFKGIELPATCQFRSYDRNQIHIDADRDAPHADAGYKKTLSESLGEYGTPSADNYIYINVWDWDPSWKVEVIEDGKPLKVTSFSGTDPLHVLAYNVTRADMNKKLSFPSCETRHLFKAQASAPDTPVTIRVTDRFGRTYIEQMDRPKPFSVETYMNNQK